MKPLSEQALEEEILVILRYPNGKRSPRNSIAEEIRHEQAEKLLDLILSDRKAWGEHVIDDVVAHTLENVYPLDVFPRTTKEDKDKINQIDGYLHSRAHIDGIYHGLHILRREARGLSAREDLEPLPQETLEYYEKKRNQGEKTDE